MINFNLRLMLTTALLLVVFNLGAQTKAVKLNAVQAAFSNVNAGVEFSISPKWTLDVSGSLNAWDINKNKKWKHWIIQPEARYWFCNKFAGHFVGVHALGGQFNVGGVDLDFKFSNTDFSKLKDERYQGWLVGAGVVYGYSWILGKHWNLEGVLGLGYAYTCYDKFRCLGCGKKVAEDQKHHYVGPTKIAINLVYSF